jgi:DNA-directed RNA polymerase subunit L
MRIRVLKRTERELRLSIEGEAHTFCNLLQDVLLGSDDVEFAGYRVPHPLFRQSMVYVRAKSGKPQDVLANAATLIKNLTSEFREEWRKALEVHE